MDKINKGLLFWASNVALITTAMSFAIRGDIMGDFEREFVVPYVTGAAADAAPVAAHAALVKTYTGVIGTAAFWSFGLAIFFGGPLVDLLGMGFLLRVAAACHIGGALLTIFAPSYYLVVLGTLIVGAGNGLVEAVCNPLVATLYPEEKTLKLTRFHAWFPGGIVIGGVLAYFFGKLSGAPYNLPLGWQPKMALLLIPAVVYSVMILGHKFPATERAAAGLPFGEMIAEALRRPLFLVLFLVMWFTAATELGPGTWIPNIYNEVMADAHGLLAKEGVLAIVWGSLLMYLLREFGSGPIHKVSPVALIMATAPIAALGLFLFKFATTPPMFFLAATLLYIGVCFWWPTMLGITSERCPRTGALGLAVIGGTGSISTAVAGPVMGRINDAVGPRLTLQIWAILPVVITIVFVLVYLNDKAKGGYKKEVLVSNKEGQP
jgi:MFS family permease